jgi:hypothetical protein
VHLQYDDAHKSSSSVRAITNDRTCMCMRVRKCRCAIAVTCSACAGDRARPTLPRPSHCPHCCLTCCHHHSHPLPSFWLFSRAYRNVCVYLCMLCVMCACVYVCMCVYVCVSVCMCGCACMCVYECDFMHTHTCTYTPPHRPPIHTHTCTT